MLAFVKKLILAACLALVVLFAYQNLEALSETTQFSFDLYSEGLQFNSPKFPLLFMFVVCFLLGMLTAGFHGVYERMARKMEIRKRDKRIRALEKELDEYKAQVAELKVPAPPAEPAPEPEEQTPEQLEPPRTASDPEDVPTL